jgi:hypothetical protein
MKTRFSILALAAFTLTTGLSAQDNNFLPGDILVMLKPDGNAATIASDLRTLDGKATGISVVRELSKPMRTWLLHFDASAVPQQVMLRAVERHPAAMLAQNNHEIHERSTTPNDPNFGSSGSTWRPGPRYRQRPGLGHHHGRAYRQWRQHRRGGDGGRRPAAPRPDRERLVQPRRDPGNSIDDDGNGYVDDYRGWSVATNDDNAYGGPHGTSVAGMIGATGDNSIGVAGANWHVKIMPVEYASLNDAEVMELYTYPLVMRRLYNESGGTEGAFVVATNASWGIDGADHTDYPLWCAIYDSLGTEGVLNCGATANNAVDIDVVDDMPTGCESDFMISVTATDDNDMRTFSAWGATTIDVGAPGDNIYTTQIGGGYGNTSGTSFASPLTAGVIGLLYSAPCADMMDLVHSDPMAGAYYSAAGALQRRGPGGQPAGQYRHRRTHQQLQQPAWIMNNCGACPNATTSAPPTPASAPRSSTGRPPTVDVQHPVPPC